MAEPIELVNGLVPDRQMVDATLFIGRTGREWRYLPERHGAWTAVRAQWRRWRSNGVRMAVPRVSLCGTNAAIRTGDFGYKP